MVWTVEAADETEEMRGTGERSAASFALVLFLPSLLLAFFSLPRIEEDWEEDEAGRMTDSLRGCPSGCWSIGGEARRCGGDSIAQKRTRWPTVPSVMVRRGEV